MIPKPLVTIYCTLALLGITACGELPSPDGDHPGESGLLVGLQLPSQTDVTQVKYRVYQRDCPIPQHPFGVGDVPGEAGLLLEETTPLKPVPLPAGLAEFADRPFHRHSRHQFADLLLLLAPGCYQVQVQPLADDHEASHHCLAVYTTLEVVEGITTEELLISQCYYEPFS